MTVKLRNPALLLALDLGSRIADGLPHWLPLNEGVRQAYLRLIPSRVQSVLQRRLPSVKLQVVPRNSVAEKGGFNVFLSDLDFTVISNRELEPEELKALLEAYESLGRYFLFLGEIEVYTTGEWKVLEQIKAEEGRAIETVWNLRKLRWQKDALGFRRLQEVL